MASLPYPRSLLAAIFSHRFHRSAQNLLVEKGLPQISLICTEPSRCDSLPQISQIYTDVGGYGILAIPTQPSYCDFLPQISQIAQKLLVEKGLPQIARIYTDVGGYGILAIPTQPLTQPTICVDQCNPWENCIPTERRIHSIPNTHHL